MDKTHACWRESAILQLTDKDGFKRSVYFVAASNFFTMIYKFFSRQLLSVQLSSKFTSQTETSNNRGNNINLTTLAGFYLGMIVFGHLADKLGRKSLYGVKLLRVTIASICLTQASKGKDSGM